MGHRWLDLKRTGNIDAVMTIICSQKAVPGQLPALYRSIVDIQWIPIWSNIGY